MKYYVIYEEGKMGRDVRNGIIAFHESKKVIRSYLSSVPSKRYQIGKCKEKELQKIPDFEDLYLIKFSHTYIQRKFYDMVREDHRALIQDMTDSMRVLERILSCEELSRSDTKILEKSVMILLDLIEKEKSSTMDYESLEEMERYYEEMRLQAMNWELL